MRMAVTGASGFLGRHLLPILKTAYPESSIIGLSSKDYDLINPVDVKRMFTDLRPSVLIHLAAYSGGIGANRDFPADFYYRNTLLTALVFEHAAKFNVKKLIYMIGGCSYPAKAKSPIHESQMWEGYPQTESAAYSTAKKMGVVASLAYRQQYDLNSIVLVPGNMYGEFDNFRNGESHVIPAIIRRFYEAELANLEEVIMWGSGNPVRDFVYAGDVAKVIPYFINNYNSSEPVNISSGTSTSIYELTQRVKEIIGFDGKISWDLSKPDGQLVKIFDVKQLHFLGLKCDLSLREGLKKTIEWFTANYKNKSDGIRL